MNGYGSNQGKVRREQSLGAGDAHEGGVTPGFGPDDALAQAGKSVVAATIVIEFWVGPTVGFLNELCFEQSLEGALEGSWAHCDSAFGGDGD